MPCEAPVMTATFIRGAGSLAGYELLAAVDVVRRPGQSGVGHDVDGKRGDVLGSDDQGLLEK
jgi:hypothetical protein